MLGKSLFTLLCAAAPLALAQPVANEKPMFFEVASLKPAAPGQQGGIIRPMRGNQSYVANNMPLRVLIRIAYGVSDRQLSGGPDWISTETFDMDAKAEKPATVDELHLMNQPSFAEACRRAGFTLVSPSDLFGPRGAARAA